MIHGITPSTEESTTNLPVTNGKISNYPNRRARRRRVIDRKFTKKGYAYGIKVGSKRFNILQTKAKRLQKGLKAIQKAQRTK